MANTMHWDVVIIGGALFGGSTAYHLLKRAPGLRVCVVERDPTYARAPSALSVAGIRVLFSQPENLQMSLFGHEFFTNFGALMGVDGEEQPLHFSRQGYLFIANTTEQAADMQLNFDFQVSMGCDVQLLDPAGIQRRFPSINVHDIVCAEYSPNDGWIDPYGALTGLRRKARSLGAHYLEDEVVDLTCSGRKVTGVTLKSGTQLSADFVVNTAGVWAPEVCAMVGMKVPVLPLPRAQFYFEISSQLEKLPLVRDQAGPGFRPEGQGYISGMSKHDSAGQFVWDIDHDVFESEIWPRLANRVTAFETLKVKNSWAGHYAQNVFDGNLIIGPWTGQLDNFLVATGCSGHGLQHAPAIGRALSELILDGRFTSLDLSRLTYQRIANNQPYLERGVKA